MIELKPNCLLTRHPILLVDLAQGWMDFLKPIRWYAKILRAHGYEVVQITLENPEDPQLALFLAAANEYKRRFHLMCDFSAHQKVDFNVGPVTTLQSRTGLRSSDAFLSFLPWQWRPQLRHWRDQILNLAISLAENDLKCSH
ncbi:MAG: hypothetical protein AB7N80_02100 [Bdellovibrionales bacterium]